MEDQLQSILSIIENKWQIHNELEYKDDWDLYNQWNHGYFQEKRMSSLEWWMIDHSILQ